MYGKVLQHNKEKGKRGKIIQKLKGAKGEGDVGVAK